MELNNITNTGTWGEQVTRLNDNFNKVAMGIDTLQSIYESLSQSDIEVVDTLPQTGEANKIYRLVGTTSYSDYMYNADALTTPILMATYNNAIESRPKKASLNLVTSGGVFDNIGALDVSELNATENPHTLALYVDLSATLAAVPIDYQKGGMSIKFVRSTDNKYVQARCMAQNFTTDVTQWQGVDNEPTAGSDNLVKSGGVAESIGDIVGKETSVQPYEGYGITIPISFNVGDFFFVKYSSVESRSWLLRNGSWQTTDRLADTQAVGDAVVIDTANKWYKVNVTQDITYLRAETASTTPITISIKLPGVIDNEINNFLSEEIHGLLQEGYLYCGLATPSANPGAIKGKVFYIAKESGTYANFGGLVVSQGFTTLKYDGSWSAEQIAGLDNEPVAESSNLTKSGGIKKQLNDVTEVALGNDYATNKVLGFTQVRTQTIFDVFPIKAGSKFKIKVTETTGATVGDMLRIVLFTSLEPVEVTWFNIADDLGNFVEKTAESDIVAVGLQTTIDYNPAAEFNCDMIICGAKDYASNLVDEEKNEREEQLNGVLESFNKESVDIINDVVNQINCRDWYSYGAGEGNYLAPTRADGEILVNGIIKANTHDGHRCYAGFVPDSAFGSDQVLVFEGYIKGTNIGFVELGSWSGGSTTMLTQDVEPNVEIYVKGFVDISTGAEVGAIHFDPKQTTVDMTVTNTRIVKMFVCEKNENYTIDDYLSLYTQDRLIPKYYDSSIATKSYVDAQDAVLSQRIDEISEGAGKPSIFDTDVVMLINYGQSLSVGGNTTKTAYDFHKMLRFLGGSNEWYSEVNILNASSVAGFYGSELLEIEDSADATLAIPVSSNSIAWMQNLENKGIDLDTFEYQFIGSTPGLSGEFLARFLKDAQTDYPLDGFNAYQRLMFSVSKAKELANKAGKTFSVGAVFWVQGEADSMWDEYNYYYTKLKQLVSDLNTDIKAATGQTKDIAFITYQMSSYLEPNAQWEEKQGPSDETWIALRLALEGQEARKNGTDDISRIIYYGSSMYQYNYGSDLYHPLDRTVVGLQAGINAERIINENNPYPVFMITDCQIQQDIVNSQWLLSLRFDVPVKPMRFYYPNDGYHNVNGKQVNYGFRLVNSNDVSIIAAEPEIRRGDTLVIRCSQNPTGCKLSYAVDGHFGGGNLCDSQNQVFVINNTNYFIDNFCPSFKDYVIGTGFVYPSE